MSFFKKITKFLSNPWVRGASAVAGAAGAAGLLPDIKVGGSLGLNGGKGTSLTTIAGLANLATGAASMARSGARFDNLAQLGLGGFNVLQNNKIGGVGGFGSIQKVLGIGGQKTGAPVSLTGSRSGGGMGINPVPGPMPVQETGIGPIGPRPSYAGTGSQDWKLPSAPKHNFLAGAGFDSKSVGKPTPLTPPSNPGVQIVQGRGVTQQVAETKSPFLLRGQVATPPNAPSIRQGMSPGAPAAPAAPPPAPSFSGITGQQGGSPFAGNHAGAFEAAVSGASQAPQGLLAQVWSGVKQQFAADPLGTASTMMAAGSMLAGVFASDPAEEAAKAYAAERAELLRMSNPGSDGAKAWKAAYVQARQKQLDELYEQQKAELEALMAQRGMTDSTVAQRAFIDTDSKYAEMRSKLTYDAELAWQDYAQNMMSGYASASSAAGNAAAIQGAAAQAAVPDFSNISKFLGYSNRAPA